MLAGRGAKVFTVAFSPGGAIVATGFGDDSTSLWNAATRRLIDTIADPRGKTVNSVAFSPGWQTLATGDKERQGLSLGFHQQGSRDHASRYPC